MAAEPVIGVQGMRWGVNFGGHRVNLNHESEDYEVSNPSVVGRRWIRK